MSDLGRLVQRLEKLLAAANHEEGEWQLGQAGHCNLVAYNGEDVVGIAVMAETRAKLVAATHNALPALLTAARELEALKEAMEEVGAGAPTTLLGTKRLNTTISWVHKRAAAILAEKEKKRAE